MVLSDCATSMDVEFGGLGGAGWRSVFRFLGVRRRRRFLGARRRRGGLFACLCHLDGQRSGRTARLGRLRGRHRGLRGPSRHDRLGLIAVSRSQRSARDAQRQQKAADGSQQGPTPSRAWVASQVLWCWSLVHGGSVGWRGAGIFLPDLWAVAALQSGDQSVQPRKVFAGTFDPFIGPRQFAIGARRALRFVRLRVVRISHRCALHSVLHQRNECGSPRSSGG